MILVTHLILLFGTFAHAVPHYPIWTAPMPSPTAPYAGYPWLPNVTTSVIFYGSEEVGDYNHGAMIHYWSGTIHMSWKNGVGLNGEDKPGQRVKYSQSTDYGLTWTPAGILFPSMNTSRWFATQFAGPFAVLNGRLYASATPGVIGEGKASGYQFCLWPDGLDPRNAGPPGHLQPKGVLMMRRVYEGVGNLGPVFWVSNQVPLGFEESSAAEGILLLNETDEVTQMDIQSLNNPLMPNVPCQRHDDVVGGTTKCEACIGGCQNFETLCDSFHLVNERSYYSCRNPETNATIDTLLYRTEVSQGIMAAAVRVNSTSASDWSPLSFTNIPNDNSNMNSGVLPDGRVYLVHNPLPNAVRDPITVATSTDGVTFDRVHVIMSCHNINNSSTCVPRGPQSNGPSYPQAIAIDGLSLDVKGLFLVVATNNKEDVVISRVPLHAIP